MESNKLQRITNWLETQPYGRKRKRVTEEATPRASIIMTPLPSTEPPPDPTPSLYSSINATSRSSSPSKRQRLSGIEFSNPSVNFHSAFDSLKIQDEAKIPTWVELMDAIAIKADRGSSLEAALLKELNDICKSIRYCEERSGNEDAWCDHVIYPCLNLAKELSLHRKYVDILNVKSIDVYPRHLLPQMQNGSSLPTKRVDYTIGLEFTTRAGWKETVRYLADLTLNQSDNMMIRDRILCSHIEVKTNAGGYIVGKKQLALWCTAGFKKMASIHVDLYGSTAAPSIAPMPLWLWMGRDVQLFVAIKRADSIHILDRRRWTISDENTLRDVLETIIRVMDWGWEYYRPWFLGMLGRKELPLPLPEEEVEVI